MMTRDGWGAIHSLDGTRGHTLPLPDWVGRLEKDWSPDHRHRSAEETDLNVWIGRQFSLYTACIPAPRSVPTGEFRQRVIKVYGRLAREIGEANGWHPVRIWNFIPSIRETTADGLDRYMVFNSGRWESFQNWFGPSNHWEQVAPAATGIGHGGDDLMVHVLCHRLPGRHLGNPRQVAPWEYSPQYGPIPPCFARATIVPGLPTGVGELLIGGTASVRGEATMHAGDWHAQVDETLKNLASVVHTAHAIHGHLRGPRLTPDLESLRTGRIYVARTELMEDVRQFVQGRVPHVDHWELFEADICRPDLLVEIEATACFEPAVDDEQQSVAEEGTP